MTAVERTKGQIKENIMTKENQITIQDQITVKMQNRVWELEKALVDLISEYTQFQVSEDLAKYRLILSKGLDSGTGILKYGD